MEDTASTFAMANEPSTTTIVSDAFTKETRGPGILAALWTLVAVGLLTIILRAFSKRRQGTKQWADDWFLLLAWTCVVAQSICATAGVRYGLGKHMSTIPPSDIGHMFVWMFIPPSFAILGASISKTAYAILLLRLTLNRPWMKFVLWFAIISMNLFMSMAAVMHWAQCQPIKKGWDPSVPGTCWDKKVQIFWGVSSGIYSGVMDLLFAFIPWLLVRDLRMRTRLQRIELGGIMSLGILAAAAAFIKCVQIPLIGQKDFAWDGMPLIIWPAAEAIITIMAASAPIMRVLVRELSGMDLKSEASDTNFPPMIRRWTISCQGPTAATLTGGTLERRESLREKNWYTSGRKGSQEHLVDGAMGVIRVREVPNDV